MYFLANRFITDSDSDSELTLDRFRVRFWFLKLWSIVFYQLLFHELHGHYENPNISCQSKRPLVEKNDYMGCVGFEYLKKNCPSLQLELLQTVAQFKDDWNMKGKVGMHQVKS